MEEELMFFECALLPEQLSGIEHKSRSSLFTDGCLWTAMDVNVDVIAIGTDVGILIVFDRLLNCVTNRLTSKLSKCPITCIKMFKEKDMLIAFGNSIGYIIIIHYTSFKTSSKDRLQAFTIKELHTDAITSIEWASNGHSLFSGDKSGNILQTDLNLNQNTNKSIFLNKEESCIVQLSYFNSFLLVSTLHKSTIYNLLDVNDIKQIGKHTRKKLDKYGAIFFMKGNDVSIYASRQGLRLWKANFIDGSVALTYQLKEQLQSTENNIFLLNQTSVNELIYSKADNSNISDLNLGRLVTLDENHLISFSEKCFIIINVEKGLIDIFHTHVPDDILSIVVVNKEIYILLSYNDKTNNFQIIKFSNKKTSIAQLNKRITMKELTQKAGLVKTELENTLKHLGDGLKIAQEAAKDKILNKLQAGKTELQGILESKKNLDIESKLTSIILGRNLIYSNDVILINEDNLETVDNCESLYPRKNKIASEHSEKENDSIINPNYSIATHLLPKKNKKKKKVPTATLR